MSDESAVLSGANEDGNGRERRSVDVSDLSYRLGALKSERLRQALTDLIGAVSDSTDYQKQAPGSAQSGIRKG